MADQARAAFDKYQTLPPKQRQGVGCGLLIVLAMICNTCTGGSTDDVSEPLDSTPDVVPVEMQSEDEEPTEVAEEPSEEPEPTATDEPSATPEPTEVPATDTPIPTAVPATAIPPTAVPATAVPAPTNPPPPSGAVADLAEIPPEGEPWHPCARGQIKANQNSGIYHSPGGSFYRRTYKNVWCFNSADEARSAGYRAAER